MDSQLIKTLATLEGADLDSFLINKFTVTRAEGSLSLPIDYFVMNIDPGWIIRSRRTFTQKKTAPITDYL